MKRYKPLLLISFFTLIFTLVSTTYLAGYADKQNKSNLTSITLYTTLPVEQVTVIAQEYEKAAKVRVNVVPLTAKELITRLASGAKPQADILLADRNTLKQAKNNALLAPYQSEYTERISTKFQDTDGYWTGVWYDPIIFAANKDYLKNGGKMPLRWSDLTFDTKSRVGITDFLAADAAANLYFSLVAANGEEQTLDLLKKLHPRIVQYSKFLATPARMVSMGEADIAVAVNSEAMRYAKDGLPLQIIYPEDGTAYLLTGVGLVRGVVNGAEAKHFIDWLTQDGTLLAMDEHKFCFVPTNTETRLYREYAAKNIKLLEHHDKYLPEEQHKLLDKWVQTVRLGLN